MIAVVQRNVRVKEFGATELGFSDGAPITPQAVELFKDFMLAVKTDEWRAKTNPVNCACTYCIDEGQLERSHEQDRKLEKANKQAKLDADAARKSKNRGHWIYDREGREV